MTLEGAIIVIASTLLTIGHLGITFKGVRIVLISKLAAVNRTLSEAENIKRATISG